MLWNNVESKPYGFYPLGWDLRALEKLGGGSWNDKRYEGRTLFEAAEAGQRVLGWRPGDLDYAHPNCGEDDCASEVDKGASFSMQHAVWFFYLARICNHCTYPGWHRARADRSTSGPRTASCSSTKGVAAATRNASRLALTRRCSSIR
jgi:nitrate reductase beta subunit